VRFVKSLYAKAASHSRVRRLSLDAVRAIFNGDGVGVNSALQCPLTKELFLGNTRNKGELSESEWVLRWHLALTLEPAETTSILERLMLDHEQVGGAGGRGMVVTESDLKSERNKPAMMVENILVFGSCGCGKSALLNSFIPGS